MREQRVGRKNETRQQACRSKHISTDSASALNSPAHLGPLPDDEPQWKMTRGILGETGTRDSMSLMSLMNVPKRRTTTSQRGRDPL